VLVDDKATLMQKLGKKQLTLVLEKPLAQIPPELTPYALELAQDGNALVYTFSADHEKSRIADLLRELVKLGIGFKDLDTRESSLEDIFVKLVSEA
jgi:ABC-2 type transport system ATP-binding protein